MAKQELTDGYANRSYYIAGGIQAIDVIEAWELDFALGSAVKYICRAGRKTNDRLDDLNKAAYYILREIEKIKKENEKNG